MKCWVGKRTCEWKKILVFVILILCSIVACELALEYRKTLGMVSVKDYIITYNYRVVPYIPIPVILFFLISHIRRMYDDNKMVRYVNIRKFYLDVIENGIHNLILYVFIMACMVFVGGIISTHGVVDNWNSKEAMAQRLYGSYLADTNFMTIFIGVFATLVLVIIIDLEMLMILYRCIHSWIVGYFICIVIDMYMLMEKGSSKVLGVFMTYLVYQKGWQYTTLLYPVAISAVLFAVVMIMGNSDNLRRNR